MSSPKIFRGIQNHPKVAMSDVVHQPYPSPDASVHASQPRDVPPAETRLDDDARLFAAFVSCRTTLEDLSDRAAAAGERVSGSLIASHLTGKLPVSAVEHNAVADAINERLGELSLPAAAPYREESSGRGEGRGTRQLSAPPHRLSRGF